MNRNPFWFRTAEPDPNRYREQERRAAEAKRLRETAPPTLFDVQDYAARTGREAYARNIGHINMPALDRALTADLQKTQDTKQAMRIRQLLLTAIQGGYMQPEIDIENVKAEIRQCYQSAINEAQAFERAGDNTGPAENAEANWLKLMRMFDQNFADPEASLEFIEDQLASAYHFQTLNPENKALKNRVASLRQIRDAVYWRVLYPKANLKPKTAA